MPKIFLILIVALFALSLLYLPSRRFLAYQLHLSGDKTTSCCEATEVAASSGDFDEEANVAVFGNQTIDYPKTSLAQGSLLTVDDQTVLGTKNEAGEDKWIEVSLDQQKLRAWEGNRIVREFPISSGLWSPTPTGDFAIWYKTRYQRMKGGSKEMGTFYDLPNVPFNMFFNQGYAVHGAYWHNNFGHPMSHGCVNSPISQAAWLFDWSGPVLAEGQNAVRATSDNPGTRVFVH
ncbi:MAG: L,D-transpeptidase [bacterium]|nr:L,D-transpeptidase [bacterium]